MTRIMLSITALSLLLIFALSGCFAGPDSKWTETPEVPPQPNTAGFIAGLWHGFIAVFALILGILSDISIYEVNNSGWWYNFGFLLGVGAFSSGGIKITSKRKRR